uniref:Phospholipid/glycerol acyltransferase domain-containing protein n=1 Tax=Leersia perrieri TaxID=77586 RepID=A0A0D9XL21_9ORYZ
MGTLLRPRLLPVAAASSSSSAHVVAGGGRGRGRGVEWRPHRDRGWSSAALDRPMGAQVVVAAAEGYGGEIGLGCWWCRHGGFNAGAVRPRSVFKGQRGLLLRSDCSGSNLFVCSHGSGSSTCALESSALYCKDLGNSDYFLFYKLEVEGMENLPPNTSPAVYVANHQSFLDIYTLLTLGRCFKFISKTSIFMFPIIGWAMYLLGVIPLRRMDSRSQLDCLKRCVDLVKKGASVFFFPEGTRSKDGKLGAFKCCHKNWCSCDTTLLGTGKLMPSGMEGILNSGSVKVIIHHPIEGNDAEKLCSEARKVIAGTLILNDIKNFS